MTAAGNGGLRVMMMAVTATTVIMVMIVEAMAFVQWH
jgi:hypothetical protein